MPRNGYWIECIPLPGECSDQALKTGLEPGSYQASVGSFPDLTETAPSPDKAIEQLRERLRSVRQQYHQSGKILPEMDNPVRPPTRWRNVQGWISVYVEVGTCGTGETAWPGKPGKIDFGLVLPLCLNA